MNHIETQQTALDFFFEMIRWVFNDFLIRVTVLGVPVLWFFIAFIVIAVVISGVINTTRSGLGNAAKSVSRRRSKK